MSALILREEEKVFLLRRNFKIKRLSDKLDYLKFGLFRILERYGRTHYKLELLKDMKVYPIFYIVLLELVLNYILVL